ncbi:sigma factor-like helix-turn-helix DNA-binding protein [Actinoplanes auranticolor]|uniref:RNA polymerase sigma factor n=1 Tax=Actinoplanes auranticolor TaxID=47988 RepID=A0A919S4S3_9ACTN|nr:sigma factor-like helix-turn-helix DNA-binding protein [Actinoplanes auranticolor]GIM63853.1 RNA polymerase sigma factor [Actinoplanes auranticolor]
MADDGSGFAAFFERHHAELSRLAYLLTGDAAAADDLAADALGRMRRAWPRVGDDPAAHARGLVATLTRDRGRRRLTGTGRREAAGTIGLSDALRRLPHRRRVCVVLRYASGLTEDEVARALRVSPGTVRSRTAKGVRQLGELLGGPLVVTGLGGREAR